MRHRPSYPEGALDHVVRTLGLGEGAVVADLGAGTGIFFARLLARGLRVCAVEPGASMREAAARALGGDARLSLHDGTAEHTGLSDTSVDAIVAAQAFHWFDPAAAHAEALRILRPRGTAHANAALVWNARRETGSAFLEEYEALLRARATDYERVRHQNVQSSDALARFFGGPFERWSTTNTQVLDWHGLAGRAESSSYVPARGTPAHAPFFEALRALFERTSTDGHVTIDYAVDVYTGRVR